MSDSESNRSSNSWHSSACYSSMTADYMTLPRLDAAHLSSLYLETASDEAIDAFLKKSKLYDFKKKLWTPIHEVRVAGWKDWSNRDRAFMKVIAGILRRFGNAGRSRKAEGGREGKYDHAWPHRANTGDDRASQPDLAIKATGPSFELPAKKNGATLPIGFTNVASCITVNDKEAYMEDDELFIVSEESEVLAREMFIQQPNRRFIRNIILSRTRLRLFHWDRTGIEVSDAINIHDNPHTFIRIILGISSPDEEELGFDTSIQWTIREGRKTKGTLETVNAEGQKVIYDLVDVNPIFQCLPLKGKATTCWKVRNPNTGQLFVVKDTWRLSSDNREYEYLEKVKGLAGVAQMVSFEANRCETKEFRGRDLPRNRIQDRIVLHMYGETLSHFKSAKQALCALRDAIDGHRRVCKKEMLHRDISMSNILLGNPEAAEGNRGILIDFDSAAHGADGTVEAEKSTRPALYRPATGLIGEDRVWLGMENPVVPAHDHLDELEAFYYVTYHLLHSWVGPGNCTGLPTAMERWTMRGTNGSSAGLNKHHFLLRIADIDDVPPFWGHAGKELLAAYHQFFATAIRQKNPRPSHLSWFKEGPKEGFGDLGKSMDENYGYVVGLFDTAIAHLEAEPTETLSPLNNSSDNRVPKRNLEDDHSDSNSEGQSTKRICLS